ncbi:MAG: hypothetical protein ACI9TV_002524 [Sulfurimonas sp.]|jgi:hypothetical protein|uniref:hypothetical protein n=1 Tax=Sulfurimonas sp. TaxID=2022749 RepID=UPI0039E2B2E2
MGSISSQTKQLFQDKVLFEKKILNVENNQDREDVVSILAIRLVRDSLKEHLNFLYIEKFSDFSLKQIVNIVFKEIANEWVDYAMHILNYSKSAALDELRIQHRVKFLKSLSSDYYNSFKDTIFEEIADTFIELLVQNTKKDKNSILINAVINSDLIPNRSVLNINSWNQLSECVKVAIDLRGSKKVKLENFESKLKKVKKSIIYSLSKIKD